METRPTAGISRLFCAIVFLGVFTHAALGQTPVRPGSLHLTVRDATDLAVAGAELTLTDASGATRVAVASDRGEVVFDGLAPGVFSALVTSPGFTPLEIKDL